MGADVGSLSSPRIPSPPPAAVDFFFFPLLLGGGVTSAADICPKTDGSGVRQAGVSACLPACLPVSVWSVPAALCSACRVAGLLHCNGLAPRHGLLVDSKADYVGVGIHDGSSGRQYIIWQGQIMLELSKDAFHIIASTFAHCPLTLHPQTPWPLRL